MATYSDLNRNFIQYEIEALHKEYNENKDFIRWIDSVIIQYKQSLVDAYDDELLDTVQQCIVKIKDYEALRTSFYEAQRNILKETE